MYTLPELDKSETKKLSMNFFKKELDRIENIAGSSLGVSLNFTNMKHHSNTNVTEEVASQRMDARELLKYIWASINELSEQERDVILMRYIKRFMWAKISKELHCSEVRGHEILNKALINFAEKTNARLGLAVYR
ncbi:hypothetical protein ESZ50_04815 [Weissella muntiaci]|uniref:RNA polymerase sigma factor 70 region 4 type 2 domain-containing protein n=1 Tax=Weissella muntiaci TaxID=2508881 RepID=A0A6C2CA40_9LACO|nr:ArpU family phage packaging/lysis transcriptional regulator [Weissella muntiaci]TYC49915.1 hypothetical protein ESZ50_04815 [Weissella muntiaci]